MRNLTTDYRPLTTFLGCAMIGTVVRQLRQQRKLSQEALANSARVSSGYLSKLERGVYKEPSLEVISRIADALSITPADLYKAAGLEHLFHAQNPNLNSLIDSFNLKLSHLPKRDREIIISELRRIYKEEEEAGGAR